MVLPMIRSMTAYGRAEGSSNGKNMLVEIKSVNNRYFDCSVKVSRLYGFLEEKIKNFLQNNGIARGKVDVYVSIDIVESLGVRIDLDEAYAQGYIEALRVLRDKFSLSDDISVMTVAQNRDIFNVVKPEEDIEQDWQDLLPVLKEALNAFTQMRIREGENLRVDILKKIEQLEKMRHVIAARAGDAAEAYRQRLESKLRQVLSDNNINIEPDSSRIITECAIFADKTAVDEEMVRLCSHFEAFRSALNADEPVGRKLDFLLQEMNREVNTTGSKVSDADLTALVVEMKCELEKIREQIQNLE